MKIKEINKKFDEKIEDIIKNYTSGVICSDCHGGGSDGGQGQCKTCKGLGIVEWQFGYASKEIQNLYAREILSLIEEIGENVMKIRNSGFENYSHKVQILRKYEKDLQPYPQDFNPKLSDEDKYNFYRGIEYGLDYFIEKMLKRATLEKIIKEL